MLKVSSTSTMAACLSFESSIALSTASMIRTDRVAAMAAVCPEASRAAASTALITTFVETVAVAFCAARRPASGRGRPRHAWPDAWTACSRPRQPSRYRSFWATGLAGGLLERLPLNVAQDDGIAIFLGQKAQLKVKNALDFVPVLLVQDDWFWHGIYLAFVVAPLAAMPRIRAAVLQATVYNQTATLSRLMIDAALHSRMRKVA